MKRMIASVLTVIKAERLIETIYGGIEMFALIAAIVFFYFKRSNCSINFGISFGGIYDGGTG